MIGLSLFKQQLWHALCKQGIRQEVTAAGQAVFCKADIIPNEALIFNGKSYVNFSVFLWHARCFNTIRR
jgi:hypothetical protein